MFWQRQAEGRWRQGPKDVKDVKDVNTMSAAMEDPSLISKGNSCSCVCKMSMHTCVHMAVEARINLYDPSLDSVKLVFLRQGLSIGPRVTWLGEASWPVSPRDLSPQRLDYKTVTTPSSYVVAGMELRSSCLCGKHLTK